MRAKTEAQAVDMDSSCSPRKLTRVRALRCFGPEQVYHEDSTYTGNLKHGGPSTVDTQDMLQQEIAKEPDNLVRERPSTVDIQDPLQPVSAKVSEKCVDEHHTTADMQDILQQDIAKEPQSLVHERSKITSGASSPGSPTSPRARAATEGVVCANSPAKGMSGTHSPKKESPLRYGPERFFHEERSYTGAHKKGGLETLDIKVAGQVADLSQITRPNLMKEPEGSAVSRQRSRSVCSASSQAPSSPRGSSAASEGGLSSPKRQGSVRYGPERFFYEERTYTGVHKRGGHETLDLKATGHVADLSQITRPNLMREPEGAAAARQRSRSLCSESSRAASTPRDSITASEGGLSSAKRQGSVLYGPERFFYESSTYTGVWKNGGPSVVDAKKEGTVPDISEILRPNLLDGSTEPIISTARERSQSLFETMSPGNGVSEHLRTMAATRGGKASEKMGPWRASVDGSDSTGNSGPTRYGPERFFYEISTYTGAHKSKVRNASDIIKDNGQASDFGTTLRSNLLKGPDGSSAARQRSPSLSGVSTPGSRTPRERAATESAMRSRSLSNSPKNEVGSPERLGPKRYGPERFFYDTSTYAGVHKIEKHVLRSKRAKDTTDHSPIPARGFSHSQVKNLGTDVDLGKADGPTDVKWLDLLYGQQSETRLASPWSSVLASRLQSGDSKRIGPARGASPPGASFHG